MVYRSQARAMIQEALERFERRLQYYNDLKNGRFPGLRVSQEAGHLADNYLQGLDVFLRSEGSNRWLNNMNSDSLSDILCKCVILGHYYNFRISGAPDLSGVSGNTSPFVIYDAEPKHADDFRNMHPVDQLAYLRQKVLEAVGAPEIPPTGDEGKDYGPAAGRVAAALRALLPGMKLNGLFTLDKPFMNVTLRLFLNLSENGKEDYTWREVTATGSGWEEFDTIGAQMHQKTAPDSRVVVYRDIHGGMIYVYNRLNAKFTHRDGREAVFRYAGAEDGTLITSYPDKGTFNYYPGNDDLDRIRSSAPGGEHNVYDMAPYTELMNELRIETEAPLRGKCNAGLADNSYYWRFDRDIAWDVASYE
jgi:hypothetical protein